MRFYNRQHRHYCGIDLHVKTMYICILDTAGQVLVHRNVPSTPEAFLETLAPYRDDLVVAAECTFRCWAALHAVCLLSKAQRSKSTFIPPDTTSRVPESRGTAAQFSSVRPYSTSS